MSNQTSTTKSATPNIGRVAAAVYGGVAYTMFFVTFCYAMGFVGNILVPKGIDTGTPGPFWPSLLANVALLGLFGVQHSVMARPEFKAVWTKIVPKPIERATFVLATCVCLGLMYWLWRPLPQAVWTVESTVGRGILHAGYLAGWLIVLLSTVMINHFDLFGLRQVYLHYRGRRYTELDFRVTGLYKYVRHPLMVGFLVAFWSTPDMTVGRLIFACVTTAYILVAVQIEERDLIRFHGARYEDYKRKVYGFVPLKKYEAQAARPAASTAVGD